MEAPREQSVSRTLLRSSRLSGMHHDTYSLVVTTLLLVADGSPKPRVLLGAFLKNLEWIHQYFPALETPTLSRTLHHLETLVPTLILVHRSWRTLRTQQATRCACLPQGYPRRHCATHGIFTHPVDTLTRLPTHSRPFSTRAPMTSGPDVHSTTKVSSTCPRRSEPRAEPPSPA